MFETINFKNGKIKYLEDDWLKEDMLQVIYPKGYTLDAGYYNNTGFIIFLIHNDDWLHPVIKYVTEKEQDMLIFLQQTIDEITE